MRIALEDLKLDRLDVVHAGREAFPLAERVRAIPPNRDRLTSEFLGNAPVVSSR